MYIVLVNIALRQLSLLFWVSIAWGAHRTHCFVSMVSRSFFNRTLCRLHVHVWRVFFWLISLCCLSSPLILFIFGLVADWTSLKPASVNCGHDVLPFNRFRFNALRFSALPGHCRGEFSFDHCIIRYTLIFFFASHPHFDTLQTHPVLLSQLHDLNAGAAVERIETVS